MNLDLFLSVVGTLTAVTVAFFGIQRYNQGRISRIYERFDMFKTDFETKIERNYVRKDVHDLTVNRLESDIREIKINTASIPAMSANLNLLLSRGTKEDKN